MQMMLCRHQHGGKSQRDSGKKKEASQVMVLHIGFSKKISIKSLADLSVFSITQRVDKDSYLQRAEHTLAGSITRSAQMGQQIVIPLYPTRQLARSRRWLYIGEIQHSQFLMTANRPHLSDSGRLGVRPIHNSWFLNPLPLSLSSSCFFSRWYSE